jgi:hypothetical protein
MRPFLYQMTSSSWQQALDDDLKSQWRKCHLNTNTRKATLKAISEVSFDFMRTVARQELHLMTKLDLDI